MSIILLFSSTVDNNKAFNTLPCTGRKLQKLQTTAFKCKNSELFFLNEVIPLCIDSIYPLY